MSKMTDVLAIVPQVKSSIFNRSKSNKTNDTKSKDDNSIDSNEQVNMDTFLEQNV